MLQHALWTSIHKDIVLITQSASAAAAGLLRQLHELHPCLKQASNRKYSSSNTERSSEGGSSSKKASSNPHNVAAALLSVSSGRQHCPQQHFTPKPMPANSAAEMSSCCNGYVAVSSNHSSSFCCAWSSSNSSSDGGWSRGSVHGSSISNGSWSSSSRHSSSCSSAWCEYSNASSLGSCLNNTRSSSSMLCRLSSSSRPLTSWCARSVWNNKYHSRTLRSIINWSAGSSSSATSSSSSSNLPNMCRLRGSKGLKNSWSSNAPRSTISSWRSITCKPHHAPRGLAEETQQEQQGAANDHDAGKLQQQAHLRRIMEEAGLSFPALMSVLQYRHRRPLNPVMLPGKLKQLQELFGHHQTNHLLTLAAYLLERDPRRLKAHYDGLVTVMGAGEAYAADLIKRSPDLLQHNPALIKRKLHRLQEIMQLDHKSLLRLVKKAPAIIKLQPSKLQAHLDFYAKVGGLRPHDVFKVYVSWPVMASTSLSLVKARYMALSELLQASPEDMHRICRTCTKLLGRDPNQLDTNITTLADKLGVSKEQMVQYARKEPGLLSWNVSTLVNRVVAVSQMLKLPQDKALTLLSYNRPLLSNTQELPRKVELLQKVLGVTEPELYALVHKNLPVLRFPVNAVDAKLACVSSLVCLNQAWRQEWPSYTPLSRVRMIQAGWSCHWRLVYLLQTCQQHSISAMAALRMPHSKFHKLYPDYPHWLNRYNHAVHGQNIPVLDPTLLSGISSSTPVTLEGPSCYEAVLLDSNQGTTWHAGSLFIRDREAALKRQSLLSTTQHHPTTTTSSSSSSSSSNSGGGSDTVGSADDLSSTPTAAAGAVVHLPCSPAGRLAAWLGISSDKAQQLLLLTGLQKLTWTGWQAKLAAAANLFDALGRQRWAAPADAVGATAASKDSSSSCSNSQQGLTCDAGAVAAAAAAVHGRVASAADQSQYDSPLLSAGQQQEQQVAPQFTQLAEQIVRQHAAAQQQQQQQVQHSIGVCLQPPPDTQEALAHALASGQSHAVAAVAVACLLAPFSQQLHHPPPRPPDDAALQFVVQHPEAVMRGPFEGICNALAALARASPYVRSELNGATPHELAAYTACPQSRLRYVQYLVDTQQPTPWAFTLRALLVSTSWYKCKGSVGIKERFAAAYPGYLQWEEALQKL